MSPKDKTPSKTTPSHHKSTATATKEQHIKSVLKKLTGGSKDTPAIFKLPNKRNTPVSFTLTDMRDLLKEKSKKAAEEGTATPVVKKTAEPKLENIEVKTRAVKSATLDDLLGIGSKGNKPVKAEDEEVYVEHDESEVPAKYVPYYKKLVAMRQRLTVSVEERAEQTLKSSAKDASGDLSSYGQHMADAGTDASDFDFSLGIVSSEKEMLREVESALNRIFNGTYGICEETQKPIGRDRLMAVPFTRFSKEGQDQHEKTRRRSSQRIGIASGEDEEDAGGYSDDEREET